METKGLGKRNAWVLLALLVGGVLLVPGSAAFAQDAAADNDEAAVDMARAVMVVGLALGIGITMAATAYATAKSQQAVASAGFGAMAEKPELATWALILFAIPETIIVLGFVIAIVMTGAL